MPVEPLVDAFNSPTLAAKHEEAIGKSMAIQAAKDMRRHRRVVRAKESSSRPPRPARDDTLMRAVIRYLYRKPHPGMTREGLYMGLREAGLSVTRDKMMHALLYYRGVGLVIRQQIDNKNYWHVVSDPEPVFEKENENDHGSEGHRA